MNKQAQTTGVFNVRDFGAKGNGRADDTKAIQTVLTAATERTRRETDTMELGGVVMFRHDDVAHATGPEIVFPAGHYAISEALCPEGVDIIRGEGHAWIEQRNPDRDIFHSSRAHQQTFRGLTLKGGQSHLNLGNANNDKGFVLVENCRFYNSKGIAIQMRKGSCSTMLMIRECLVSSCEQVVVSYTDMTHMRDCWLTGGRSGDGALIVTRHDSNFTMENICGVPFVNGYDQRWIDNYGTLICRNSRFGGEFAGFTPVVNFAKYWPQANASMVVLEDCWLVCGLGNNKRKCAVYCEEIPNRIDIRNCNLIGIPPVLVSEKINPRTYFKARPRMLKYTVADNVGEFAGEIPAFLKKPRVNKLKVSGTLNERQTRLALQKARNYWQNRKWPAASGQENFGAHRCKTRPGEFQEISPRRFKWDAGDYMDGTTDRCSAYVVVTEVAGHPVILRKVNGRAGVWPHVTVRNVEIDLDRFPWLTWKMASNDTPAGLAVKVVEQASGRALLLHSENFDPFSYRACNLRERCGGGGKRRFDLKLYYGSWMFKGNLSRENIVYADTGDSIAFAFLRAEVE